MCWNCISKWEIEFYFFEGIVLKTVLECNTLQNNVVIIHCGNCMAA